MNRFKKAISVGMSATLLASLFTVIAASTALASTTVTGVGTVPRGGTSTTAAGFLFTESGINTLTTAGGNFTVYIWDSTGDCAVAPGVGVNVAAATVHFTGTGTQSGPGSLGLAALVTGDNFFTVKTTNADINNVESISIGGLSIKADALAATGAIKACVYNDTGIFAAAFATGTATATGKLVGATGVGAVAFNIAVDVGSCSFATLPAAGLGPIKIGTDSVTTATVGAIGVPTAGQQNVTAAAPALAATHGANDPVTEVVNNCFTTTLGSPGTVADSLIYNAPAAVTNVFPGENNQLVSPLTATERTLAFLAKDTVVTFTISTAGVVFSGTVAPTITAGGTGLAFGAVTLDATRTMASATVTAVSTVLGVPSLTLSNIRYDVASTVASGTLVNVTLSLSGGKAVTPTSRANAQVGRIFTATSTLTTVNIGQNAQAAGLITIVEVTAGAFTDGAGPNNVFEICPDGTATFTAPGPSAFVTGGVAAGMLLLREGAVASPDNIVPGTPDPANPGCFYWTVWSKSTTASTITIGSTATVGPLVNVNINAAAGPLNATLSSGTLGALVGQVSLAIANRVFASQVSVTAVSQPIIAPGATHALAGDILIQEAGNGQLKLGEVICVEVVPNADSNIIQDVYLTAVTTGDLPIATAAGGVVIGAVTMSTSGCLLTNPAPNPTILTHSFSFTITQQSTTGLGKVTISNIHYNVVADADSGAVQVNVFGLGVGTALTIGTQTLTVAAAAAAHLAGAAVTQAHATCTSSGTLVSGTAIGATVLSVTGVALACPFTLTGGTDLNIVLTGDSLAAVTATVIAPIGTFLPSNISFQRVISNAVVGVPAPGKAATRLGVTQVGSFTTSTKVAKTHKYVTYRFDFGVAAAGRAVQVWGATKTGNDWSAFAVVTTRTANASGVVYYYIRQSSATWKSYRGFWVTGGAFTPARQARWIP